MMKRLTITLFCVTLLMWSVPSRAAMSLSDVRLNARFLSDRMAYELNLNSVQYGDVYEINYDFLSGIRFVMDGVIRGNESSIDRYYEYLDMRNEDLSYVLSRRQYLEFAGKDYFYRPVYTDRNVWKLRVYKVYPNRTYFYFSIPVNFYTYNGLHSRSRYRDGYYLSRYKHERYHGPLCRIRDHKAYGDHRLHDFGMPPRVDRKPSRYEPVRPGHSVRPDKKPAKPRPNEGVRPAPSVRPDKQGKPGGHGNVRPNQSGAGSRPHIQPGKTTRPVEVVAKPQKGKNSSDRGEEKRNHFGASRR